MNPSYSTENIASNSPNQIIKADKNFHASKSCDNKTLNLGKMIKI